MSSAICFNLEQSKILLSGNELNLHLFTEAKVAYNSTKEPGQPHNE